MPHWKRTLIVLAAAQFLTMIGFSSYLSFIPYYLQEMGNLTYEQAMTWFALFSSLSAVSMMVAAPIWGGLSDRYGRKVMLVRATASGAVLAFLMGLAQSPGQLLVLRIFQGAMCGTVSAATTIVATQTPDDKLGTALGVMQTTQFLSQAIGPVLGGVLADSLGYRSVFPISSAIMVVSLIGVVALVKEQKVEPARERVARKAGKLALRGVFAQTTIIMLAVIGVVRLGTMTVSPVMALYIKSLAPEASRIATLAGSVTSVTAFTSSLAALVIGRLGDKFGQKTVLLISTICIAILYAPQAFVHTVGQLMILRAVQGIFVGGTMPTANALLARSAPASRRGMVFGFSASLSSGGHALGPMVGAAVGQTWGMASCFLVSSGIYALVAMLVGVFVHPPKASTNGDQSASATSAPPAEPVCEASASAH